MNKGVFDLKTLLSVSNLQKSFKGRPALKDISFEVCRGEIMAILGPNGAGKSTTIRNIMGIIYPDSGTIQFHNQKGTAIPKSKIGYLPEERGLYKDVKVMDILLYLADLKDYPLSQAKERIHMYLKKFDLEGKENAPVEELSKGMSQKVQFIGSVIHEPELLILDEPFSGLDPVSQEIFKEEIASLAASGTAILLSSHQMNLVEQICDRLFMMQHGEKVIYGTLDEVKKHYANFKCSIYGKNPFSLLKQIPGVDRIDQQEYRSTLHLKRGSIPNQWLKQLPDTLDIQELTINRISLHEIFIDIATDEHLIFQEGAVEDA